MSLSRPGGRQSGAKFALSLTTLGALILLTACGFRPLYGKIDDGTTTTSAQLAQVRVRPLPDRTGQIFHNMLIDRLSPLGQPQDPSYALEITLTESIRELALRSDETASRADMTLQAQFVLIRRGSKDVLLKGTSLAITSYNILSSQFATYTSENDARKRGLRELSEDIRAQLAVYFTRTNLLEET